MKKYTLIIIAFLLASNLYAENKHSVKVYHEQSGGEVKIYAENSEYCPVSIKLNITSENMKITGGNNKVHIVSAKNSRQLLTTLSIVNKRKRFKYNYRYTTNYGDDSQTEFDKDYNYSLPFKNVSNILLKQGYNGSFSHQEKNALDFKMEIGTEIAAIREGVIVKVVDLNNKTCGTEDCKKYNNYIIMYHSDGTFSEYTHIKQNGSIVKAGDKVKKNQVIAYSGNVGFSTGPHLHLEVFLQKLKGRKTIRTRFITENPDSAIYLEEGKKYSSAD